MTLKKKKELWKKATVGSLTVEQDSGNSYAINNEMGRPIGYIMADPETDELTKQDQANAQRFADSPHLLPLVEALESARMSLSAIEQDMELPLRIRQSVIGSLDAARAALAALEDK